MAKLRGMNPSLWCVVLVASLAVAGCRSTEGTTGVAKRSTEAKKPADKQPRFLRVYVGTYTGEKSKSKGIYLYDLDLATGALKQVALAAETASPSFLALSPDHKHLYADGEVAEFAGKKTGVVSAFAVNPDGTLSLLNQQPSGGEAPCHV